MVIAHHRPASRAALIAIVGMLLFACGDDSKPRSRSATATSAPAPTLSEAGSPPPASGEGPVPSSHTPVTASEHETFEKLYAERCIKSQQDSPDTSIPDDQELGRTCACMAKEISRRISKADAVHFNVKNEFPIDVVMMTNAAASQCMSQKQ